MTFELFEIEEQIRIKLTNEVIKDFPSDIDVFTRESAVKGWTYFIQESLKEYLDKA